MIKWLFAILGIRTERPAPQTRRLSSRPETQKAKPIEEEPATIDPAAGKFYLELVAEREPADLQQLTADDRLFLSAVMKKVREKTLEIPVMPRAALEISRLLAEPGKNANHFAETLETDPSLSVEVLRVANSAYYGYGNPAVSVRDAVVRIGLNQLRGIVVLNHLRGKVLQGGCFRQEAGWISDLSLALALLSRTLAAELQIWADTAFTRGMLMHVEHFVLMGLAGAMAKDLRRQVQPSIRGFQEALLRFGPTVRELAGQGWGLEDFLIDQHQEVGVPVRLTELRRALIAEWTGEDLPYEVYGVPPEVVDRALKRAKRPDPAVFVA
jgi:HD-like signal output (HDOD) protein